MPDLLSQLQSIRTQLAHDEVDKLDPARRSEAAALAQMIMVDIEDPGNLIDRIIYQVGRWRESCLTRG